MKPSDRTRILDQALTTLAWLNTMPHTLDNIVTILRETTRVRAAIGSGGEGHGSKGSHSDPTSSAVVAVSKALADCAEQVREIDHAVTLVSELTGYVEKVAGIPSPEVFWSGRQVAVCSLIGRLETIRITTFTTDDECDHDLVVIGDTVAWLGSQAFEIARGSVQPKPEPVKQVKRKVCERCASFGFDVAVSGNKTRCDRCIEFRKKYHVQPNEKICRLWYFHPKRTPSDGMIAEARGSIRGSTTHKAASG